MNIYYLSTSLPDYFGGHHNPVIQIMVTNKTTYKEIKESMLDCTTTEHLEDLDFENYKVAVEVLFNGIDMDKIPPACEYIEPIDTDDYDFYDSVYMFFV